MNKKSLSDFIPLGSEEIIRSWLLEFSLNLKITKDRTSKLGDFRKNMKGSHDSISVNYSLNPYSFLLTLVHEISHAAVYSKYKFGSVKPHGQQWKEDIRNRLEFLVSKNIFPTDLVVFLQKYIRNPKAASSSDQKLVLALAKYDAENLDKLRQTYLSDLKIGEKFSLPNGMILEKGERRRTRFLCQDDRNNKKYTVSAIAKVIPLLS